LARGLQIRGQHPRANIVSSNNEKSSLGIINGKTTSIQKFPFMVAILLEDEFFNTGVILNSRWILTTAYTVSCARLLAANASWRMLGFASDCGYRGFARYEAFASHNVRCDTRELSFRIGSTKSGNGGQIFTVDHFTIHENYTGRWDNDLAVVKLNKPIKFGKHAKPSHQQGNARQGWERINLGTESLKVGTKGMIAGWGGRSESEESSPVLMATKVTVSDWQKCKDIYPDHLTPRQICTYDTKTGPCNFDWGDPLVYKGALYGQLAGISDCLSSPVVYTDVPSYVDWIKSAIQE
ncbi:snake venom serine protease ussurase-like, partial [Homalodisca vitripennis]|uniref:snake venom serine protease ussurase-like n=1 Tax=Homalodisca vitripennis TaxID=197043 RepID=UPI001EECE2FE